MAQTYEWKIEKTNKKGEYEYLGTFIGTTKAFNTLKRTFEIFVDTEEGYETSFKFTKTGKVKKIA